MPENNPIVQRELGAISNHLESIDSRLTELLVQAQATNGRLKAAEVAIAILNDREKHVAQLRDRVSDVEARPRMYLLGVGGPVLAAIIGIIFGHGI